MAVRKTVIAGLALAIGLGGGLATEALADGEQFIPLLIYRTGPYAPNGIPIANGMNDYFNLVNQRDGGVGGVKLTWEECETAYNNDRGVECYERLKDRGPTGASVVNPYSDRHHLRADRARHRRQDPDPVDGLRPHRRRRRPGLSRTSSTCP